MYGAMAPVANVGTLHLMSSIERLEEFFDRLEVTRTVDDVVGKFVTNVQFLKAFRKMSNQDIADAGGYGSRQVVGNRLKGATIPTFEDLVRFAVALRVEPRMLLADSPTLLHFVVSFPDWKSTPIAAAVRHRRKPPTRNGDGRSQRTTRSKGGGALPPGAMAAMAYGVEYPSAPPATTRRRPMPAGADSPKRSASSSQAITAERR